MNNNNTIELLDSSSSEEEDNENENENDYQVEEDHQERLESESETVPAHQNQETLEECLTNEIIEHHRALVGAAAAAVEEPTLPTEGAVAVARSSSGGGGGGGVDDVIELLGDTSDDDDDDNNDDDDDDDDDDDKGDENDYQQQNQQQQQEQPALRPDGILSIEETAAAMCSTSTSTTPNTTATATVGTTTVNSDAASTDDDDDNDNTHPRSLNFLKDHCWECHEWIHHPGSASRGVHDETSTSTDDDTKAKEQEICCYALHLHPVLEVPVCVVCAENIESVERRQIPSSSSNDNDNDNNDKNGDDDDEQQNQQQQNTLACSACGKTEDDFDDEKLFFCDYCPRIVCQKCLEQAHGRSKQTLSESITDRILSQSEDEKWRCFCCCHDENIGKGKVPRLLRKLRTATAKLFSTNNNSRGNAQRHQKQTIEELLHELDIVETKKRQCDEKLDNQIVLRQEIRQDILAEGNYNENDFEEGGLIDQVVQKTYEDWVKHQTRLFDRISILEDLIKSEQGVEALAAYRYIDDKNKINNNDESGHIHNGIAKKLEEEEEPHWKISADRALAKKAEEERLQMRRKGKKRSSDEKENNHRKQNDDLNHPRYRLELTEDVEDLGSSCSSNNDNDSGSDKDDDDDDKDAFRNDWRSSFSRARQEDIELACDAEDLRRVEENKARLTVRSRSADKEDWTTGLKEMANKNSVRTLSSLSSLKPPPSEVRTISVSTATASSSTPSIIEVPTDALQRTPSSAFQRRGRGLNNNNNNIKNEEGVKQITIKASPAPSNNELQPLDSKSFKDSSFVLSENPYISIADHFARHLKPHQKEGIKFMYNNSFADLGDDRTDTSIGIGGCILAHSMGLGKSLACVSLLHAIMLQPSLVDTNTNRGSIHKVLLVVPVNTLSNWENEFEKWTKGMNRKINITNISSGDKYSRKRQVKSWSNMGGILLSSDALFRNMVKHEEMEKHLSSTDAIVLDESHTMLKNKDNQVYKALMKIKTIRRICLSGTPFVNNLLEYYRMVSYIRPGLLGDSEKFFQNEYINPIEAGMASDAEHSVKIRADELLTELFQCLQPHVHRRDASILLADLPSLQQVCLHLRPTTLQRVLYREYNKHKTETNQNNFLKQFASLRTVNNHPGTLFFESKASKSKGDEARKQPSNVDKNRRHPVDNSLDRKISKTPALKSSTSEDEMNTGSNHERKSGRESPDSIIDLMSSSEDEEEDESECGDIQKWWVKVEKKFGADAMKNIESGNKCIALFHILAHASILGEKTVVFSQSLKTLDFLTEVLASKDWQLSCPSLQESFPGISMGGWTQNVDFLRIDGQTSSNERGELLKDFSNNKKLKLFLISSVAGGIGTNLVSANRVVLMDSHFNPTIDLQAIYRCYRYGQTRNVFAYRLLTQGSMEEKVYSRAVNKTGLGNRVIDGKELRRCFKQDEINSLATVDDWVECVRCQQWRMLPPEHTMDMANIPDDWHCEMMDDHDKRMELECCFPEKDAIWYSQHFRTPNEKSETITSPGLVISTAGNTISKAETEKLVERDEVLKNILTVSSSTKNPALIVSKHYFHDALLTEKDLTIELDKNKPKTETKPSSIPEVAEDKKVKRKLNFKKKESPKKQKKKKKRVKVLNRDFNDVKGKKKGNLVRDAPSTREQGGEQERKREHTDISHTNVGDGYNSEESDDSLTF